MKKPAADYQDELDNIDIKNWVTKSNELIESTYKLTLQEQRILLIMASKVQPSDETLKAYRFRARDFIEIIGNKKGTGFYSYLKDIVNGLQTKVLTIKKDGKQRNYSWVITSIYEENEGYITLQFHPNLKDFFLELKEKFTTYQLENVVRLNSVYSIRIYELLKQYERLKKREFPLEELRSVLGIEPTKYKQYGHFKSKVLLGAQNEINKKTDIQFDFNEFKSGRKVIGIEFIINSKVSSEEKVIYDPIYDKGDHGSEQLTFINDLDKVNALKSELTDLSVPNDKLNWILDEFSEEQIIRNIQYVKERKNQKTGIKHIGSYTIKAIQKDYGKVQEKIDDSSISEEIGKTVRTEVIPEWFYKEEMETEIMENGSLEQKQYLYFKKRGTQEEFENHLLKIRDLKINMTKEILKETDENKIKEAGLNSIIEALKKDIKKRKDVGIELQSVSDFNNPELKDIYQNLLEQTLLKKVENR